MRPLIPAISTATTGPLGVMHLPRLWLKNLLFALDRLPPGYKSTTGTFDRLVIDTLGFDESEMLAYFKTAKPDYLQFEAWVKANARHLDETVVRELNGRYLTFKMSAAGAQTRRQELGIEDTEIDLGITLNDLDDWSALHRQITSGEDANV
jgi:hypothetical protein